MTNAFAFILLHLFTLWIAIYVDDCYTIEPDTTAQSALDTLNGLARILGLVLAPDKQVGPTASALLLGANITIERLLLRAELPTIKANQLIEDMERILKENCLTSAYAAKLRGRLGFSQSLLFGRFGKALLTPITKRQYTRFRKKAQLNSELRFCIKWWIATLKNPISRTIPLAPRQTLAVYSDASGSGHLGVFLAFGDSYSHAHTHIPQWFHDLNLRIYELETCAALLAILIIAQITQNASIILCVDNTGTQNALVNGSANNAVVNQIVATFWQVAAQHNLTIWIERVDSPTNIADAPSRICGDATATNTFIQKSKRLPLPKLFVQIIQTPEALRAAQYTLPPIAGEFILAFPCKLSSSAPNAINVS